MSELGQSPPFSFVDLAWRMTFRLGFPLARLWWRVRRPTHEGALVAVYVGPALLLLRSSYQVKWCLPGGGVQPATAPPPVPLDRFPPGGGFENADGGYG